MNDFDDELSRQLASLDSDLAPVRMPGAAAARRRAAQRTRHQLVTGVLAGVAVIGLGIFGANQQTWSTAPEPPPPAHSESPERAPTPEATASPEATATVGDIPAEALMTVDDIDDPSNQTWQVSGRGRAPDCSLVGYGHAKSGIISFVSTSGARITQHLLDDAAEIDRFAEFRDYTAGCVTRTKEGSEVPELPWYTDKYTVEGVGDEAFGMRYFAEPVVDDLTTLVDVVVARYGDIVSLTIRTRLDNEANAAPDYRTPANAMQRACRVIAGTDCVGDPVPVGLGDYPDLDGIDGGEASAEPPATDPAGDAREAAPLLTLDGDPLLTDSDLNPVGSYGDMTSVSTGPDGASTPRDAFMCLPDFSALNADEYVRGEWSSDTEGSVDEVVLLMPDIDSAAALVEGHASLPAQCGEVSPTHEQIVGQPVRLTVDGADSALAWTVVDRPLPEDPGSSGSFFGVAMAHRANVVVILTFGAMGDAFDGDWAGYAAARLGTALDRAVGE